ncbi:MAG: S-methyl-5-thioribose-1-phosphate isomerase [Candidatus Odinarchaeota archaeon]|nr:S-methyl-5-thioribose-1-phosphate isomerase [Candidatus Odinarchaeota archaeon]
MTEEEWPILSKSAWIEDDTLIIVDETKLPFKLEYIKGSSYHDAVRAIKEMRTRAAGQLYTVLYAMLLTARKNKNKKPEEILKILKEAADALGNARPTFPLKAISHSIYKYALEAYNGGKDVVEAVEHIVAATIKKHEERIMKIAQNASQLIKDGDTVLTHCNISGILVLIARECRKQGKNVKFIATETRPYLQGARLTAWELKQDGFSVTLITDNAVAYVMWKKMVDLVIVGADRCALNGDIANKIGTYQIAMAAFEHNVPFYVIAWPDPAIPTGKDITIEERDPNEVLYYQNIRLAPEGVNAYYPAFDVTPAKYISGIITPEGIYSPRVIHLYINKISLRRFFDASD